MLGRISRRCVHTVVEDCPFWINVGSYEGESGISTTSPQSLYFLHRECNISIVPRLNMYALAKAEHGIHLVPVRGSLPSTVQNRVDLLFPLPERPDFARFES